MFAVPKRQYAKVALDTERAAIAYKVATSYGFNYDNSSQLDMYNQYGDSFGNEVWLNQKRQQCTFRIGFRQHHDTIFSLVAHSKQYAQVLLQKFEGSQAIDDNEPEVRLPSVPHFKTDETFRIIAEKVEEVFEKVP